MAEVNSSECVSAEVEAEPEAIKQKQQEQQMTKEPCNTQESRPLSPSSRPRSGESSRSKPSIIGDGAVAGQPEAFENPQVLETVFYEGMAELYEGFDHEESLDADMRASLGAQPLFQGCSPYMMESVSALAKRVALPHGQELPLEDNGVMYIIERGSLQSCAGLGPATIAGPGSCFNVAGMLGLHREAEAYKPRAHKARDMPADVSSPYEVIGFGGHAPNIFDVEEATSRCSTAAGEQREQDTDVFLNPNVRCFYNLCPHACSVNGRAATAVSVDSGGPAGTPVGGPRKTQGGWLAFTVLGVEDAAGNPTRLIRVPVSMFEDLKQRHGAMTDYDTAMRKSIDKFRLNCKGAAARWNTLLKHCSQHVFPSVPPDVMWAIAEISQSTVGEPGHNIVSEGEHDGTGESIIVLENGVATVEKFVVDLEGGSPLSHPIGRMRPGAIIGDIRFLGCSMPRAASVRAKTRVEAALIPARGLLSVLSRFPGMLEACETSLLAASDFMQHALPNRVEVLASLKLFACCHMKFLGQIAVCSARKVYLCGQIIIEEASEQQMLYALEYGCCSVEVEGQGQVNTLAMGSCFGEKTLLGFSKTASATVRALSPYVLLLAVPQEALNSALERYEGPERAHFEKMKESPPESQQKGGQLQHVELFRSCTNEFCECLADSIQIVSYMPGQTIVVQEIADDPNMYVIMGGSVIVERSGKFVTEMQSGATFGELVMLDLSKNRSCTIRAITFCVLMEIPRSGFSAALGKFPDDIKNFKGLDNRQGVVHWPCLQHAPDRLQYLLDLYADQRRAHAEEDNEVWTVKAAAILVIEGHASVVDQTGNELEHLVVGQCRDYHYMIDLSDGEPITWLKPSSDCKVKLVTKEIWEKVLAEFPSEEETCKTLIKEYSVQRAQEKMHFKPGGTQTLKLSAVFRALSEELVQQMVRRLASRLCTPGSEIIRPEQPEHGIYVVLAGNICVEDHRGQHKTEVGRTFGESVLLGVSSVYPYTVEAASLCTVQFLAKSTFDELIQTSRDDNRIVTFLQREAIDNGGDGVKLIAALQNSSTFKNADPKFLSLLCEEAEAAFYAPSDVVFMHGEEIVPESPFYLLLAGQVNIESKLGVHLGSVRAVEVFGEAVIQGNAEKRSATVVAWEVGLAYCARIPGDGVARAFEKFPEERAKFIELFHSRQDSNADIERNRRIWLKETAMPALVEQDIFGKCCTEFLWALATPLHEVVYEKDQTIVSVGEPAHSMFIILGGEVAMESKKGARVSVIRAKASFGELAVLGLLPTRTTTLRAISAEVCAIEVTSLSLQHALSTKHAGKTGERFKQYVQLRQEQVSLGLPLSVLKIDTVPQDVSVSAVALHSQKVSYKTGQIWYPLPEDSPYGPRYSIVTHGRCNIEMKTGRKVLTLVPGSLILEGIAAEFDACIRAITTPCEVSQIYLNDFKIACSTVPEIHPWIWRFKVIEKKAKEEQKMRLSNMYGLIEGLAPHTNDEEIRRHSARRDSNIRLAKDRRGSGEDSDEETKLPDISSPPKASTSQMSTSPGTILKGSHRLVRSESRAKARSSEHDIPLSTGLSAYPTFHLPCLQQGSGHSLSSSMKSRRQSLRSSRSTGSLRQAREL